MICFGAKAEPERINTGTNDEITVVGYVWDNRRVAATAVVGVLSGGLILLLLTWRASIRLWFTHRPCELEHATRLLCTDIYGQQWEEEVMGEEVAGALKTTGEGVTYRPPGKHGAPARYFVNKNIKYVWDEEAFAFTRLRSRQESSSLQTIYYSRNGLSSSKATQLLQLYGENFIEIHVLSVLQLILIQIQNPFYVFQLYTIVIWLIQSYYVFAVCIAVLSLVSIGSSVWETRKQSCILRETMTTQSEMHVIRNATKVIVSSRFVVPGDVVVLEAGAVMEVDVMVVDGTVVVSEAVLTGESVPVTKVGLSQSEHLYEQFDYNLHKKHIMYSGCEVLQVRGANQVLGIVVNTGFNTCRGELVRSILFPKPIAFHLYSDFLKLLFCFVILGFVAMGWNLYMWLQSEPPATWQEIVFNTMDLMTFVVPPILPATMTAINVWAQRRLKRQNIFCLSSNYVSLAGPVDVACFDKTGTLTQEDLELAGVIACSEDGSLCSPVEGLIQLDEEQHLLLKVALAACHTLTSQNTEQKICLSRHLLGHPMDLKIFSNLNWELEERYDGFTNQDYGVTTPVLLRPSEEQAEHGTLEVAQLKIFPFDSNERRMTVIAMIKQTNKFLVLSKGAPEIIAEKCNPKTVPENFDEVLTWYTLQGLRVMALAGIDRTGSWHHLEQTPRESLETDLRFLGFVLFHNPLKPETPQALQLLQYADIETVMITGDNLATAISVARSCGLVKPTQRMVIVRAQVRDRTVQQLAVKHLKVTYHQTFTDVHKQSTTTTQDKKSFEIDEEDGSDHQQEDWVFVLDGHTWQLIREYDRMLLQRITYQGRVFARMKPDQKVQVIEELRDLGRHVAMCGDGCNDCGALKAAHVGVSLSPTETSVAAPFTSTEPNIACVEKLMREGRATLDSTYASFKYNISYSFAALVIVLIHFSIQTEPSDLQYLIMDLVLITVPSLVLGNTAAPSTLVRDRPTRRILHPLHLTSILSFLALQIFAYWACWTYTAQQPWFDPYKFVPGTFPPDPSYENTALVIFSFYTFIIAAIVFSHSKPFRKPFYTNYILTAYLLMATACVVIFTFCSADWFNRVFNFRHLPEPGFRWLLLLGALVNLGVCYLWERCLLYGIIRHYLLPWAESVLPPRYPYQRLALELAQDKDWPPLVESDSRPSSIHSISKNDFNSRSSSYNNDDSDEETSTQVLMMRKLSRKRHFKVSVPATNYSASAATKNSGRTQIIMTESIPDPSGAVPCVNLPLNDYPGEQSTTRMDAGDSDGHVYATPTLGEKRDSEECSEYQIADDSYMEPYSSHSRPALQTFSGDTMIPPPYFAVFPVSTEAGPTEPVYDVPAAQVRPLDDRHIASALPPPVSEDLQQSPLAQSFPRNSFLDV